MVDDELQYQERLIIAKRFLFWYLLLLVCLSCLTIGLFVAGAESRYQVIGPNLTKNKDFSPDSKYWQIKNRALTDFSALDNSLVLSIPPGKKTVSISALQIVKLPAKRRYRISAELNVENITVLPDTWHGGRLLMISLTKDGKAIWSRPHLAAKVFDTDGWVKESRVFSIGKSINWVRVGIQLTGLAGKLAARNIELVPVEERTLFTWAKRILLVCWGCLMFVGIVKLVLFDGKRRVCYFPLLVLIVIISGVTASQSVLEKIESDLKTQFIPVVGKASEPAAGVSSKTEHFWNQDYLNLTEFKKYISLSMAKKTGHFFLFFCLFVSLLRAGLPGFTKVRIVLVCLLFAFMTEMLQFFVDGRQANPIDFGIDAAGIMTAVILTTIGSLFGSPGFIRRFKFW